MAKLLFICLGNICRSPLAEGIFLHLCRERGLAERYGADSAGIGDWHVGDPPDHRAAAAARKHGVSLPGVCRQVKAGDFREFDQILSMDASIHRELLALCPTPLRERVKLMREYDPLAHGDMDVPDPYYGGPEGFDAVFDMLHRSCGCLLDALEGKDAGTGR